MASLRTAHASRLGIGLAAGWLLLAQAAVAQAPAPVGTVPIAPPPTASPGDPPPPAPPPLPAGPPSVTLQQDPAPGTAPPAALAGRPTLVPNAGDTSDVDEVALPDKPVLALSGTSSWDVGLKSLRAAFGQIEAELGRQGIAPAGRPLAIFVQTGDDDFRFDAMVPIPGAPGATPALPAGMRFARTPSGKAYRFVHKGAYDDIDTTYETITTYLDAKDILAKDAFVEEFVNDVADSADGTLEVNIFVQPR